MLEWYEHAIHGAEYETFYGGRFLENWIEKCERDELTAIFSAYDRSEIIDAVCANKDFFTKISGITAARSGLIFPHERIDSLSQWVHGDLLRNR